MSEYLARTEIVLGKEGTEKLKNATVAIFGIGGVGGYVTEALARSGVGHFVLVDSDAVDITNINRQIIALRSTVGKYKVDVMKERILDINPDADVDARRCFYLPENASEFDFSGYTYVVDAVDTVTAKLSIIERAKAAGVPVISSMGAGNKLDASAFRVSDIYDTKVCPLAKVMRHECQKRGIKDLKVVYSEELPTKAAIPDEEIPEKSPGHRAPGSVAFVPSVCGLIIAGEVVKDISGCN
ncbi:MAG: tRNA threonylcarbamoyladenosine dehydratase [Lachnospiraceae bacterium]|nr:tRNA threonylcarbamoyladenosine dehydratase [Lachnospiraceae bacterium]